MDTGKHRLIQPAYGILKKLSFILVVSSISKLLLFFLPCQWTSFHLFTMLNPVKDVLFNKIKKPTAYCNLTPWSFLASEYLYWTIFCSCFVLSLPSCFCMLHWSAVSLKMPIYNPTLHLRNYHPRKIGVVWMFTSYLRSEVTRSFCTINDFACFCILLCLLVQNNAIYLSWSL